MFFLFFFLFSVFSVRHKNSSGTAEWIFMKLLPNDSGENVVSNVVPKWGLGPQIILWGYKLHIAHLVVTPCESLRISLLALCSYGGCVKKS